LRFTAPPLSPRTVSRRATTQSVPVGMDRICAGVCETGKTDSLVEGEGFKPSRKREITFETAPLDDSGYLLLRQIPAPSLQGPTDRIPLPPPLAHWYTSAREIKSSQSLPRAASNTSATADSVAIIGGFRSEDWSRRARGQTPSKCLLQFPRSGGGRRYRWSSVALPSV
jgi:hypothetical protein